MKQISNTRLVWADVLKSFACLVVVIWHSSGLSLIATGADADDPAGENRWALIFVNSIVRFSVPVFLMVTGIFLLEPSKTVTAKKLLRYILRISIVVIITSLIWAAFEVAFVVPAEEKSAGSFIMISMQSPYHMWYLWALLGIYIIAPVLRQIAKDGTALLTAICVGAIVVFGFSLAGALGEQGANVLPSAATYLVNWADEKMTLTLSATFPVIYVLAGYWLAKVDFRGEERILALSLATLSVLGGGWMVWRAARVNGAFTDCLGKDSVFVAMLAAAIFTWFSTRKKFSSATLAFTKFVSPVLLWTYAVHAVILEVFWRLTPLPKFYKSTGLAGVFIVAVVVFVLSVLVARIIEKGKRLIKN